MKLNLTVYQREMLRMEAGALRGACAVMRNGIKMLNAVELSAEEKTRVGYVGTPHGVRWSDSEYHAEIEIGDHEAAGLAERLVREWITRTETAEEWTVSELREMMDLAQQMGIDSDALIAEVQAKKAEATEVAPPERKRRKG